jgi:hypothetical protein
MCHVQKKFSKLTKQMMAPLPFFRLPSSCLHPFDQTAIDVAGPYDVVVDKKIEKRWMVVM